MDSPIGETIIDMTVAHVIGEGMEPEPTPDANFLGWSRQETREWKQKWLRYFNTWAESTSCDFYRRNNFFELQRLLLRSQLESGDVFALLPRKKRVNMPFMLTIQAVEADCVADPNVIDSWQQFRKGKDVYGGVQIDQNGKIEGYWFYVGPGRHPLAIRKPVNYWQDATKSDWVFIPAYGKKTGMPNVLHLMQSTRPNQRRGVPLLTPAMEHILIGDRYIRAEARAADSKARVTIFVGSENPDLLVGEAENFTERQGEKLGVSYDNDDIIFGDSLVQYGRPGEAPQVLASPGPPSSFPAFMQIILEIIGAACKVPAGLIRLKYDSSYSATRGELNTAGRMFAIRQAAFTGDFNQPIYEALMDEAVMFGYIDCPGYFNPDGSINYIVRKAYNRAKWHGPGITAIDEGDDVKTCLAAMSAGLMTGGDATSKLGYGDFYENVEERGREIQASVEAGLPAAAAAVMTSSSQAVQAAEAAVNGEQQQEGVAGE